jgi:NAD+ synthase
MHLLSLNRRLAVDFLVDFIGEETRKFGFERVVIGLSGGIDSALSAALATRALGKDGVLAVCMPHQDSVADSLSDAKLVAEGLGLVPRVVDISEPCDALLRSLGGSDQIGTGNLKSRLRMTVLYDLSRKERALVLGTSNKTELLLGYGTLHGDMACGLNPIGDLYKMQVYALAEELGLPERVRKKAPSADLWVGQTDEGELGFSYELADRILVRMIDRRASDEALVEEGLPRDVVARIRRMVRDAQHKRQGPVIAKVGLRTVGADFLYLRDWGR